MLSYSYSDSQWLCLSINTKPLLDSSSTIGFCSKGMYKYFHKSYEIGDIRVLTDFPFQISKPLSRFSDHVYHKWFIEHYFQLNICYIVQIFIFLRVLFFIDFLEHTEPLKNMYTINYFVLSRNYSHAYGDFLHSCALLFL